MITSVRKQLPNYDLPSEGWSYLSAFVGQKITAMSTGIWFDAVGELQCRLKLDDESNLWRTAHGGPFFLTIDNESTLVVQSDDFTRSLALRVIPVAIVDGQFLSTLYEGDSYFPPYLRVRNMIPLEQLCVQFCGKLIERVRVLKLPDNFFGMPTKGVNRNEVVVAVTVETGIELLIAFRMAAEHGNGHCLLTWQYVDPEFPVGQLSCVADTHKASGTSKTD